MRVPKDRLHLGQSHRWIPGKTGRRRVPRVMESRVHAQLLGRPLKDPPGRSVGRRTRLTTASAPDRPAAIRQARLVEVGRQVSQRLGRNRHWLTDWDLRTQTAPTFPAGNLQRRPVRERRAAGPILRHRVGHRPASEGQVEGVAALDRRQVVGDRGRGVARRQDKRAGRGVHSPRWMSALTSSLPLWIAGRPQSADQRGRLRLGGLFPADAHGSQHPEPAQQVVRVTPARQRTHVPQQAVPQIAADRLDLMPRHAPPATATTSTYQQQLPRSSTAVHGRPSDPDVPGGLVRQRHAQMLLTHRLRVEPWPELVQSTDHPAQAPPGGGRLPRPPPPAPVTTSRSAGRVMPTEACPLRRATLRRVP